MTAPVMSVDARMDVIGQLLDAYTGGQDGLDIHHLIKSTKIVLLEGPHTQEQVDRLAGLTERALREVYGMTDEQVVEAKANFMEDM